MEPQLAFDPSAPASVLAGAWVVVGLALSIFIFLVGYLCGQARQNEEPRAPAVKDEVDEEYKRDLIRGDEWRHRNIQEDEDHD